MKTEHVEKEAAYITEYLTDLVGCKVVHVQAFTDTDMGWPEVWPILVLQKPDGTLLQVEVSRDPEGNGPGHLFIAEKEA